MSDKARGMARLASALVGAAVLTLVSNRIGWLVPVLWIAAAFASVVLAATRRRGLDFKLARGVAVVWGVWILSYALTGESWRVFFSFDFQRRDGQIFFCLVPLLVTALLAPSPRQSKAILMGFLAAQVGVALLASGFDILGERGRLVGSLFLFDEDLPTPNFCALYQAHNAAGSVLALGCLVAATLAVFESEDRRRRLWGGVAVPLLWGVILSKSRGSLLALLIALGVLAFLSFRGKRIGRRTCMALGIVMVVTAALFGSSIVQRLGQLTDQKGTHNWRLKVWKQALGEWWNSPLVGEGMGRFNDEDREWSGVKHLYYVVTRAKVVNSAAHAHNSYVHFLAEGGVIGLGVSVGLWVSIAWRLRRSRDPLRIAAFLGVLFLFAISFTEHYMGGGAMLLVLTSIVGAAWNLPEESGSLKSGDR